MLDGLGRDGPKPLRVSLTAEVFATCPTRIRVGSLDANPIAVLHEDVQRLAAQGLRDLLGICRRCCAQGGELAGERMFA